MDLSKIKKIYIIGIEGAGTSALARMFKGLGKDVSGSDEGDHFYFETLQEEKIKVFHGFDKNNIPANVDLVVHSLAYKVENNQEMAEAAKRGLKTVTYGEALSFLFNQKFGIAVCGSHGKTTTSAWLAFVLHQAGKSPSAVIGSKVKQFGSGSLVGFSDYLVIEADEYGNKLKYLNPKAVLLNNIDYDHPDFFPTKEAYNQVFIDFIEKISGKGFLVTNFDDEIIRKIANVNCRGRVISYAIENKADYVAYDIKQINDSSAVSGVRQIFKVKISSDNFAEDDEFVDSELGDFSIQLSGRHNIYNALAVIAASIELGLELVEIRNYLEEFIGTSRRMEIMGEYRGVKIIDDYAHHPTEIKTTLAGIKQAYEKNRLVVVFHPHTFTRTKALLDDFAGSFQAADEIIILDIFGSARETQGGVHSRDLVKKIQENDSNAKVAYIPDLKSAEEYLRDTLSRGDLLVLMGAGEAYKIGEKLLR